MTQEAQSHREEQSNCQNCISQAEFNRFDRMKWIVLGLLLLIPFLLWLFSNPLLPLIRTNAQTQDPALAELAGNLEKMSEILSEMQAQAQGQHIDVDVFVNGNLQGTPSPAFGIPSALEGVTNTVEIETTRIITHAVEITSTPTPTPITVTEPVTNTVVIVKTIIYAPPPPTYTPEAGDACTRFNLEEGRNKESGALDSGLFVMSEISGRVVATWKAERGWKDSGWLQGFKISADTVHVGVQFYPDFGGYPIQMEIVNPAPGTDFGWLANGICHAIEIQFPEE